MSRNELQRIEVLAEVLSGRRTVASALTFRYFIDRYRVAFPSGNEPVVQLRRGPLGETLGSSAMKLALAGVGERSEDGAGVLVHGLTKVHGDGK